MAPCYILSQSVWGQKFMLFFQNPMRSLPMAAATTLSCLTKYVTAQNSNDTDTNHNTGTVIGVFLGAVAALICVGCIRSCRNQAQDHVADEEARAINARTEVRTADMRAGIPI